MPSRTITLNGAEWTASIAGRSTQYVRDEFAVVFARRTDDGVERRIARYSPLGAKRREASLASLTERELLELLQRSQPSWTAPELGYRR